MSATRVLGVAAVALAVGCGTDASEGVPVGEAAPPQTFADDPFGAPSRAPDDTTDALDLSPLRGDSLRDSLVAAPPSDDVASAEPEPTPDFAAAWRAFVDGRNLARTPALGRIATRALAPPFGPAVRDASPRTFRRDGDRRTAVVRVGFDAAGAVVPQDEAVRDSTVRLVFDLIDGAYRLVDADLSE